MLIDVIGGRGIGVRFAIHEDTPRTPNGTCIQQNRAVELFCPLKSVGTPGIPIRVGKLPASGTVKSARSGDWSFPALDWQPTCLPRPALAETYSCPCRSDSA